MFEKEKITPDIVCKLSMQEMRHLGIKDNRDMMRLRVECLKHGGSFIPQQKCDISKETLERLIDSGFKIREIATLLHISEKTVYRRMNQFGLRKHSFTYIDEETLQLEVSELTTEFPRLGEAMIHRILHQRGIKVHGSHRSLIVFEWGHNPLPNESRIPLKFATESRIRFPF